MCKTLHDKEALDLLPHPSFLLAPVTFLAVAEDPSGMDSTTQQVAKSVYS